MKQQKCTAETQTLMKKVADKKLVIVKNVA